MLKTMKSSAESRCCVAKCGNERYIAFSASDLKSPGDSIWQIKMHTKRTKPFKASMGETASLAIKISDNEDLPTTAGIGVMAIETIIAPSDVHQ